MRAFLTSIKKDKKAQIVLACISVLILIMNCFTVKIADDFIYSQSNGILDIFAREYEQYMTWSGRSVAHVLARTSLALPRILFVLCNSLMFIWLILLICFHAGTEQNHLSYVLILSAALVFLFVPMFGETVLWQTGSFNYLWMTCLILTFLIPYREEKKHPVIFAVIMFIAGIPAGWTNENTAGAMILFILGAIAIRWFTDKKKPELWMVTGLAGTCIGMLFMLKAPGNAIRMQSFPDHSGLSALLISAYEASLVISGSGDTGMRTLWLVFAFTAALAGILSKEKKRILYPLLFAFCSFAAVYAMIFSPVYINYSRSMFGSSVFLIIGIVSSAVPIFRERADHPVIKPVLAVCICLSAMNYMTAMIDLVNTRYQFRNFDRYISSQKAQGNLNPVVPAVNRDIMTRYNPIYDLEGIQGDCTHWVNQNFAAVHGLESITATTSLPWDHIYWTGDPELMNITDFETYLNFVSGNDRYIVLITSTDISDDSYQEMRGILREKLDIIQTNSRYLCAAVGTTECNVEQSDEEIYSGTTVEGHYFYLSSMNDPEKCDIMFSEDNLSNKNAGLTFAVYSREKGHLVDEITWRPEIMHQGIRCSAEQYDKRG